jgi:hypothetical protein
MNENYKILTEGQNQTFSFSGENIVGTSLNVTPTLFLSIRVESPVAELTFPFANVTVQLNKKLNWFRSLCYNALGFKYKTL